MLRAATGPWRTACWAVGGAVPPRGSGAAAQSPIAQTRVHALDPQVVVDRDAAALVERHG